MPIGINELKKLEHGSHHRLGKVKVEEVIQIAKDDLESFQYNHYGIMDNEDVVKKTIQLALSRLGFAETEIKIKWGYARGVDIEAKNERIGHYLVEVKPEGGTDQQTGNYFMNGLAELLQRMGDPHKKYFLGFPAHRRYVNMIIRLPSWVMNQLQLGFFLVRKTGESYQAAVLRPLFW